MSVTWCHSPSTRSVNLSLVERHRGVSWDIIANTMQSGLCDISMAASDVAAAVTLHNQARPPKRSFADVDEDAGEEPNSDELYGWIEDDEVAAEGLLIHEAPAAGHPVGLAGSRLEVIKEGHSVKKTRPSTT